MAKKRQSDFQKTQLKVGRPVGRRRNITATAFKSKKIVVRKEPIAKSKRSVSDILSKIKNDNTTETFKLAYLKELHTLIQEQPETLLLNLSDIFDCVLRLSLDINDKIKKLCTDILATSFKATEDAHIMRHVPTITLTIDCLLKAPNKQFALSLLDSMLEHHSNLIVHSTLILSSLIELVFQKHSSYDRPRKHAYMSPASMMDSENKYSPKFHINILGYLNAFLEKLLGKMVAEEVESEGPEVYWDGKKPVYFPIFPGRGGPRRFDPEMSYLNQLDLKNPYFDTSGKIEEFIYDFIKACPVVYIEEMPYDLNRNDNMLPREIIKNLSILFAAYSKVTEWAKLIHFTKLETTIKKYLLEKIFNGKQFPFEATGPMGGGSAQFHPCVQLNLALCHLCVEYVVQPGRNNEAYNEAIFGYLNMILEKGDKLVSYDIKYESIPMILKIMKPYLNMIDDPEVSEFINTCLIHLCSLLKIKDDRDNLKQLLSFFMEISVNLTYRSFVTKSDGMTMFFNWLLKELRERKSKLERKHIRNIKIIAGFKYPAFIQALSSLNYLSYKTLLRHDDGDVRDAAIFLIYHMEDISGNFLENLTRTILLDKHFPKANAIKLIRILKCRFFEEPENDTRKESSVYSSTGFVNFTVFLINILLDTCNMNKYQQDDFDNSDFAAILNPIRSCIPFDIIPSCHWEEHQDLYQACSECLRDLPQEAVKELVMSTICLTLERVDAVPIHCAIAMMKLDNEELKAKPYRLKMYDLTYSCLMTLSVLESANLDDSWYQWNVNALQDNIALTRIKALNIVEFIQNKRYVGDEEYEGFAVYQILRIINCFIVIGLFTQKDAERMVDFMHFLKEECKEKSIYKQPLFLELCEVFSPYD